MPEMIQMIRLTGLRMLAAFVKHRLGMKRQRPSGRTAAWLKAAMAMLLLAALGAPAHAALTCKASQSGFNFSVPTGTFKIPRDAPIGMRLTPFTSIQRVKAAWTCDSNVRNILTGPVYQSSLASAGMKFTEDGQTYEVFKTNLDGVGLVIKLSSITPGTPDGFNPPGGLDTTGWKSRGAWQVDSATFQGQLFGPGMAFAFVKTGSITPGKVALTGTIAQVGMSERPIANVANIVPVTVTGNPEFIVLSCTTPDVTVDLRTRKSSEFSGVNSFTSSVNFNIAMNNCPAGLNSIKYQIDAVTPVINAANSVVALDPSSTASGVGVQLLDGSGNVMPLGTMRAYSSYDSATGGNYTIPLRARYYQTASTVRPGKANSLMTFTMLYE